MCRQKCRRSRQCQLERKKGALTLECRQWGSSERRPRHSYEIKDGNWINRNARKDRKREIRNIEVKSILDVNLPDSHWPLPRLDTANFAALLDISWSRSHALFAATVSHGRNLVNFFFFDG
jgi:hypothetical protein